MRRFRLFKLFFRFGVLSNMAYRTNFLLHCFEAGVLIASGLSVLWVIFSQAPTIGGWTWDELLVVMGLYFLGYGIVGLTIAPSIREFMFDVWKGNLDFLLLKPESHQFLASTRKVMFWNVVETSIGVVIVFVALWRLGAHIGIARALMFATALTGGGMLIYSFWICLATMSFWTTKMENIMVLYYNLYEAGRWPVAMYPGWLRYSLTFAVPIAFAITMPAEALIGRLGWGFAFLGVFFGLVSIVASRAFFHVGIRRYTSASS